MSFQAKQAKRERVPLLVGLCGPSSSGKTFSALRLASGIQRETGGKIYLIDTEARRSLHYADRFDFQHVEFAKPFGSLRYLEALQWAAGEGAGVIVVDSLSHEHEGPGGYLETHASELDRLAGDDWKKRNAVNFLAWAKPAQERRALINGMLQLPCHFIFCFRAKEKLKIERGKDPVDLGWMPIAGPEFVFEMTLQALLTPGCGGVPSWKPDMPGERAMVKLPAQFAALFQQENRPLDEDTGAALAKWARGDTATQPASASPGRPPPSQTAGDEAGASPAPDAPAFTYTLVDSKGGVRTTADGAAWRDALLAMFKKPFDVARQAWADNSGHVAAAAASGDPSFAVAVEAAWRARERAANDTVRAG